MCLFICNIRLKEDMVPRLFKLLVNSNLCLNFVVSLEYFPIMNLRYKRTLDLT